MFRKILKSQSGMSIVQVLIAAAMMGGLALVMGKLGENQSKMQRGAKESLDINSLHAGLEKILLNSVSCKATIEQITTLQKGSGNSEILPAIISQRDKTAPQVIKYRTGQNNPIGAVYIETISVSRNNDDSIDMTFVIKKLAQGARSSYGAKSLNKTIHLFGKFDGNKPVGCFSQLDSAVASACTSLGGTLNGTECEDTVLHRGLCAAEFKIMQLTGVLHKTTCGDEYKLTKKTKLITTNTTWTVPSDMAGPTITVKMIGGGGGGGGSDYNEPGKGGGAGQQNNVKFAMAPGQKCTIALGAGGSGGKQGNGWGDKGSGGQGGGTTVAVCNGVTNTAGGGNGGCGECRRARDRNGTSGASVTFAGKTYSGGAGGGRRRDGKAGGRAAGGGGAGDRKQRGGNGGRGLVSIEYDIIEKK